MRCTGARRGLAIRVGSTMANERQANAGQTGALDGIASHARKRGRQKGPPPVHLWNPPFCGDLDMRIAADGTWFYLKTPIGRPALVKLFASVLKREGDKYFLVTPVEKCGITVDDAPFLAVEMKVEDGADGPRAALPHQCRRLGRLRAGSRAALRAGAGYRRAQALSARAARPVGEGDAGAVLRSGRARRGARGRRASACSASPRAASSSRWRRPTA